MVYNTEPVVLQIKLFLESKYKYRNSLENLCCYWEWILCSS